MALGYDRPLYMLAFDHRGSFEHDLFGSHEPVPPQVADGIRRVKEIIFAGHQQAIAAGAPAAACGVLVDEEFGATVARQARDAGVLLAMPVERSGQDEFEFEYGEDFGAHIEAFDPDFSKVLVRYNPEGDAALNLRQTQRLARLSQWLRDHDRKFLFELLVPATTAQLDRFEGSQHDYDSRLRPGLVVATIAALQAGGVEPDVWKIEGLNTAADCAAIVAQARAGGRDGVVCIVLGRGADEPQVLDWVRIGASVDGFDGFAVGRTIWEQALRDFLAGQASRPQAIDRIASRYRDVIDAYQGADPSAARRAGARPGPSARAGARPGPSARAGAVQPGPSAHAGQARPAPEVKLFLADVDGTLVTQDKVLTDSAVAAVRRLGEAGILFAITSGRPPRGMQMLIEPLDLHTPIAAFNGGLLVDRDMSVIEQRVLPEDLVVPVSQMMESFGLDVWLYSGADWWVPKADGPHVARETWTVKFEPKVMTDGLNGLTANVAKLVGVSDDTSAVDRATAAVHDTFGQHVTAATSQPYYLDVTHPQANKGAVAQYLAARYGLASDQLATIGDMPNDVLMFAHSGLSIAMGNASTEVKRSARRVTTSNQEEGFATAVERFILR